MKIEDQVLPLYQAKRLKELLKNYEANFFWVELPEGNHLSTKKNVDDNLAFDIGMGNNMVAVGRTAKAWESIHPAFTVAELGCMLDIGSNFITRHHDKWKAEYEHANVRPEEKNKGTGTTHYSTTHDTQASAYATFLIYILENGFITPEQVNKQLV